MGLPKIDKPLYKDELPSNGETIYYRPFTVKEEKILLIGQNSEKLDQAILAMTQVINNCVSYDNKSKEFDVGELPVFDLEYLLLKIRSKAVEDSVTFTLVDEETQKPIKVSLDLDNIKITKYPNHTKNIKINDAYTLVMKYPTVDMLPYYSKEELSDVERSFIIMIKCMDKLVSDDNVYDFSEESEESIIEFLDDLDPSILLQIKQFFETTPRLKHEVKYVNSNNNEVTFVIEGTETFFV